ncbi:MAG: ArsR family transcriptional regulator [Cytophagales bacterium]|nr:ArsR family transcriptional regulator [Cytophagales bacterium]
MSLTYEEGREKFIQAWGNLGSSWGINKAMAQIQALLLVSTEPLSTEDIMEELQMSRGNVNMNIRALEDWGIVSKAYKPGERKAYFVTEKDIMKLALQVTKERRRREIEPILDVLTELKEVKEGDKEQVAEFQKVTKDISDFAGKVDGMLEKFVKSGKSWFYKLLMKL